MKLNRTLTVVCLAVLSSQVWGQTLDTAVPATSPAPASTRSRDDDLKQLRERIAKQEEEIKQLQQSVEEQRALLEEAVRNGAVTQPAAGTAPLSDNTVRLVNVGGMGGGRVAQKVEPSAPVPASPLGVSIGNTTFTPLGFMDMTFFGRSTNVGSGIGTNFAGIPYNSAAGGHLSETNFSAQNSRVGFRVDSKFHGWNVLGYLEADFLFNNNANSYQIVSNSAGFRLRNYFVDANNGKFEVLGGQDWSFLTPNRKGLSPIPSDIFYTQNMDTNYQIGLVWTRAPQVRFIAHPNENVAFGLALENPQQLIGGGNGSGAAVPPSALSTLPGTQFQNNTSPLGIPNLMPDIQAKLAIDGTPSGHAMHFEVAGFVRGFKDYILPVTAAGTAPIPGSHTAVGGGGEVNSNLEIFKNVRLVENLFFSDGGGRYIFGSAPDLVLRPTGDISLVHTHSTVDGIEAQVSPNTLLTFYYGGLYAGRNTSLDTTVKAPYPLIGYGISGSSGANQNRYIQEITAGWIQTLWKNKNYGALSLINQYSYIFREPWVVPSATAPKQAHTNMVYVDLRYTLP